MEGVWLMSDGPSLSESLLARIARRALTCGVVGLGYVGLPLAAVLAQAGFAVVGFDADPQKVAAIREGRSYIPDVPSSALGRLVEQGALRADCAFDSIADCDFVAICVPTPLDAHGDPDISCIEGAARSVGEYLAPGTMVVLESTTYPGTTQDIVLPLLQQTSGLWAGRDFYVGFSPERVDPGNERYTTANTPKVVGATDPDGLACIAAVYEAALGAPVVRVSSPAVAEMEKILENAYRSVNIALVNELAMLCDRMGISVWEVVASARTKPYGFSAFYPGPGPGGHCIPLDPCYLSWKAREYGFSTSLIDCAVRVNGAMPRYCVDRAARLLNAQAKPVNGSHVLLLGVAYKPNVSDCRESPALRIAELLKASGAEVSYYDPYVSGCTVAGEWWRGLQELTPEVLAQADLVMVTCAHAAVDYALVQRHARAILDTVNAMANLPDRSAIEVL